MQPIEVALEVMYAARGNALLQQFKKDYGLEGDSVVLLYHVLWALAAHCDSIAVSLREELRNVLEERASRLTSVLVNATRDIPALIQAPGRAEGKTMEQKLFDAYRFHRLRKQPAFSAVILAREDVAAGKTRYPYPRGGMRGGEAFKAYGEERMIWMEHPGDYMRRVGTCSEIWKREGTRYSRDIHNGWYLDSEFQDETVEGVVYQLPSRNGALQFLYGYADPHNDGAACLSLDIAHDLKDACRWADSIAEKMAEKEREYQDAWRAGRRFEDLGEQISSARQSCLELIREAKEACKGISDMPAIRLTIRRAIEQYRESIQDWRDERKQLQRDYGRADGFTE